MTMKFHSFSDYFETKNQDIAGEIEIDGEVYNGTRKLNVESANFKTEKIIEDEIKSLKIKNSEGFDRVPQRILVNGVKFLIYILKMKPEQWLMS